MNCNIWRFHINCVFSKFFFRILTAFVKYSCYTVFQKGGDDYECSYA